MRANLPVRHLAILGEHSRKDVGHNCKFSLVGRRDFDKDVSRIERDLGVLRVDDGRHRQYYVVLVVDNRVNGGVFDNVQVAGQMALLRLGVQNQMFHSERENARVAKGYAHLVDLEERFSIIRLRLP